MRREKLYKNFINKPYWLVPIVLPILKMNNLHGSAMGHGNTMFETHFCFAYISAWENDKILIFLLKDAPWKALQKLYKQICINLF